MADISKINGQAVKDATARNNHDALVREINDAIDAINEALADLEYTLPVATSGVRGGIKIGYTASGANIPLQLSSEKAYVALTNTAITSALGYTPLQKTTYEKSAELACGSNGKVCLGKFGAYDTNITIELNSTTSTTYHATIVIHSQNVVSNGTGGTVGCYVYGDADNHITPLISVFRPYGSASRQIEVYANLAGWSKNLVHVQAVALSDGGMTDVLTSVSEIPTAISGKTKVTPVNVLTTAFLGKTAKAASASVADSANAVAWGNVTSKPSFATVATSGSYNDLTNKPSILSPAGGTLNDGATLKFSTYGTRFITISGNSITADMSNETGGWAGNFASVKDPSGTTTAMLGWYGGAS